MGLIISGLWRYHPEKWLLHAFERNPANRIQVLALGIMEHVMEAGEVLGNTRVSPSGWSLGRAEKWQQDMT